NKDLNHESNPDFCPTCSTESVGKSIGRFDLKSHFYRVGIDYDVLVNTRISLDQIFLKADYSESHLLTGLTNRFGFDHATSALTVSRDFGDYVNIKLFYVRYQFDDFFDFNAKVNKSDKVRHTFGGTLEFIF
ncbi:MAG: hypothetical protein AB7H97_18105, partial [Pseudobdellovibrionaceae bacterium]